MDPLISFFKWVGRLILSSSSFKAPCKRSINYINITNCNVIPYLLRTPRHKYKDNETF